MPAAGVELLPSSKMLTEDEIVTLAGFFVDHGVRKLRLTGGEPLVRKGVVDMVARLTSLRGPNGDGLDSVGVTTNGLVLERMLPQLVDAGLTSVNISLDTLQKERFEAITRRRGFEKVKRAIDAALASMESSSPDHPTRSGDEPRKGLRSVKVNVVVMRGTNEDELGEFIGLTKDSPLDVRTVVAPDVAITARISYKLSPLDLDLACVRARVCVFF
jgi:cyclic pyranopterin phosphate synthase